MGLRQTAWSVLAVLALIGCDAGTGLTSKVRETAGAVTSTAGQTAGNLRSRVGLGAKPDIEAPSGTAARQLQAAMVDCMSGFPTFEGVAALFRRRGYDVSEFSSNLEHEFSKGPIVGGVGVGLGQNNSGCTVEHSGVSQPMAAGIVDSYFSRQFSGKAKWERGFGGRPWMVIRGAGPNTYVWVSESRDGQGAAISIEARPRG